LGILDGKKGLVLGVANDRSIAWAIARQAAEQGATLGFTYQAPSLERRVRPLADQVGSPLVVECDVSREEGLDRMVEGVGEVFGQIDFVVHSIAFANRECLKGPYYVTSREDFLQAMEISVFSLLAILQRLDEQLADGGSVLTLTYFGSVKAIPNYNVMGVAKAALESSVRYLAADFGPRGIRVNAISAGPLKTLAASAVSKLGDMLDEYARRAPLRRALLHEDVGKAGLYFLSDLSSGVTGEIHYVDCGYNVVGF
jgi:enoyl-[acyl-carrier protein] reductase I